MGVPTGTLKFQNLNSAFWWYLGPTQWRCEQTPYSQRPHLNISPWGITMRSQWANTVSSQETNLQWSHRRPTHSELTGSQLTVSSHENNSQWAQMRTTHSELTGDQHTVSSHETNLQWAHRRPTHSELTWDQLTVGSQVTNSQWAHRRPTHSELTGDQPSELTWDKLSELTEDQLTVSSHETNSQWAHWYHCTVSSPGCFHE